MKNIASETQLYVQLAHRGDPSAFYALFSGRIRELYLLLRSQGKDHDAACGDAARRLAELYGCVIRSRPHRPDRWFAARCGLKKFDATAVGAAVSKADVAAYERIAVRAVNAAYSKRLELCGGGSEDVVDRRSFVRYLAGTAVVVLVVGFLFFAQSVLSVGFERFGVEYKLSFPKIAEGLWDMSGLVHTDDDSWRRDGAAPLPARGAGAKTPP
ncbi:MAG: hypothetical protein LBB74_08235 [Chitinispirillales bacterium]|jgi:hypothetical protein|nr:hypothetical protein [Chitinispirillales bacterium]